MIGIGERLKLARRKARMSQRKLAEQAGVTAMSISKYENNEMMPSSDVLLKLSDALDVRMEFFLRSAPKLEIRPVYRKHSRMGKKAQAAIEAQIQEWLERYLVVESFYPDVRGFEMPVGFPRPVETLEDAEGTAASLREAWDLGTDPIGNLTGLLEDKGIKVGLVEGHDDFDACTFLYDEQTPVIAVNKNRPGDRQRFDLAHELGHIMLRAGNGVAAHDAAPADEEKAADRFAGAFLVPAEAVRRELGTARSYFDPFELILLREKYGMSMTAWVYRAKDLGILSDSATDQMWRRFSDWRDQEPGEPLPPEEPIRMRRLVRRLVAQDVISESRALELLGMSLGLYLKERTPLHANKPEAPVHS